MVEDRPFSKASLIRKPLFVAIVITATILSLAINSGSLLASGKSKRYTHFLPVVSRPHSSAKAALSMVNEVRSTAGVPTVRADDQLNSNCFEHARYMAQNNLLSHDQDPNLPFASPHGETCAHHANAWLGPRTADPGWSPVDSIDVWVSSVAHRMWLLYPTTRMIGYGFFDLQSNNRAAAALDILSQTDFAQDQAYEDWPVIYPREASDVPPTRFPITLQWRYFGPEPDLQKTSLRTASGHAVAHEASTQLPAGHKGIQIIPKEDLPANSSFIVTVSGRYEDQPFSLTWSFHTGS